MTYWPIYTCSGCGKDATWSYMDPMELVWPKNNSAKAQNKLIC